MYNVPDILCITNRNIGECLRRALLQTWDHSSLLCFDYICFPIDCPYTMIILS